MPYVAEIFYISEGQQNSIASESIDAVDDKEAARMAMEWAIQKISEFIERVTHLVVVESGRSVFSKTYGEI